jgi:hypothetical protein
MAEKPLWLKVVYKVERTIGEPVEKMVSSEVYFDGMAKAKRATRQLTGAVEGLSRRGLHLVNLPAGTDIRRVREQLARMDRRLVELSKDVEDLEVAARTSAATDGTAKPKRTAKPKTRIGN